MSSFAVILDYCGGLRTDELVEQLRGWNPGTKINVLDNASPIKPCKYVTHQNVVNSYTGGGIRDCLRLSSEAGARFVLFIANDIQCVTPLIISRFEDVIRSDTSAVHVSASITPDSAQALSFPWMVRRSHAGARIVPHADLLVSLIDREFISSFGGFPESRGGWGYAMELSYHAHLGSKKIYILDDCVVQHSGIPQNGSPEKVRAEKAREARDVYRERYGNIPWEDFKAGLADWKPSGC